MLTKEYNLEEDFTDGELERRLLVTLEQERELVEGLGWKPEADWFFVERENFLRWREQGSSVAGNAPPEPSLSAVELEQAARRLSELAARRHLARMQQSMAAMLYGESPLAELTVLIRDGLEGLERSAVRLAAKKAQRGHELARQVVEQARQRAELRQQTGKAVMGITTGMGGLDRLLSGWNPGLHVLAAGPGIGKTTLSLQFAWQALRAGVAVEYVTFENSPLNLMLKMICAQAGVNPAEVERGYGNEEKLRQVVGEHAGLLEGLRIWEGTRGFSLGATAASWTRGGLVVFDYLQRAAHALGYEQLRHNVSAITGEMREVALRQDMAVLAISSLNRAGGDYGRGGAAQLDSLKESGDLEYGADTVLLLSPAAEAMASPPARELELRVAKNRNGALGSVKLVFRPDLGVFREKL